MLEFAAEEEKAKATAEADDDEGSTEIDPLFSLVRGAKVAAVDEGRERCFFFFIGSAQAGILLYTTLPLFSSGTRIPSFLFLLACMHVREVDRSSLIFGSTPILVSWHIVPKKGDYSETA